MAEDEKIKFTRTGGIESSLDGVGLFYLISSIIALLVCLWLSQQEAYQGLSSFIIGLGIGILVQGIIFQILLKAAAEVIRLLKRLNGLPYGGSLSVTEAPEDKSFFCDKCGEQVASRDKYCTQCGSTL